MAALLMCLVAVASMQDAAWLPVMQIVPRSEVHIVLESGATYRGMFRTASETSVKVDVGDNEIAVDRDQVKRVAVNRGTHHRRRNAAIGLLAGAVIGAAISQARCDPRQTYCPEGSAAGGLPGLAIGGVVGALIPSGDWQVVYRR